MLEKLFRLSVNSVFLSLHERYIASSEKQVWAITRWLDKFTRVHQSNFLMREEKSGIVSLLDFLLTRRPY